MIHTAVANVRHQRATTVQHKARHGGAHLSEGASVHLVELIVAIGERFFKHGFRDDAVGGRVRSDIFAKGGGCRLACHFTAILTAHAVAHQKHTIGFGHSLWLRPKIVLLIVLAANFREAERLSNLNYHLLV